MIEVYGLKLSPPTRSVCFTLSLLDLDYKLVIINVLQREHKKPDYLKINPIGEVSFKTNYSAPRFIRHTRGKVIWSD